MGSPELDQQAIQVPPFPMNHFWEHLAEVTDVEPQGDLLKVLGVGGLERHGDPLHVLLAEPEY